MSEPRSARDLKGWREVTCREADLIRRQGAGLVVASTITDPAGQYGSPLIFTEWWWRNAVGEVPVLRDYRHPNDGCTHFIAASPDAAWTDDDEDGAS